MNDSLRQLSQEVENLNRCFQRIKTQHVNRQREKELVRNLVRIYFAQWRATLVAQTGRESDLSRIDQALQELLRLAQSRALVSDYRALLATIRRAVNELELQCLRPAPPVAVVPLIEPYHQRILDSLREVNPAAADSFEQGLLDLRSPDRKSWRGTAVEFREALRETLDILAPDDAVAKQTGFKLEPEAKGPTMKQKAVFILRSRRPKDPQIKSFGDAIEVVEELIGKFVRSVYARSSVAVHVGDSKEEARKVRDYVALVLAELLEVGE